MEFDTLLGIVAGIGLAAACGFRVFVPLLVMGVAARLGWFELSPGFAWLGSTSALAGFGSATVLEIAAVHVPWLDHLLDVAAAPLAVAAGALTMAGALGEVPPVLRWTLALVAGGGTAGVFHGLNAMLRLGSTSVTAGFGNPIFAAAETTAAIALAIAAVLAPLVALGLGIMAVVALVRGRSKRRAPV